jgi:EAL domain-containing protein (putative c-di-GMP-specific phosphodiesterase class I)
MDISVFAAAVETREESDAVRSLNVDGIQGYLVGKPESLSAIC